MQTIHFGVVKTDREWELLRKIIEQKNSGKELNARGYGLQSFIDSELRKFLIKYDTANCKDATETRVQKTFTLNISDENCEKLNCLSASRKLQIGNLIVKIALDPHLLENP